jgi:RimJ/RimL family protein N-acetyltransferase
MTTTDAPARPHATSAAAPAHTPAPVLESPRLILRGHRAGDLADSLALWSDPEVVRHIFGKPQGREEVWARVLRYIGHWAATGYGFWHVRERATDRFVGEVGIAEFQREIAVSFDGAPEAGWAFVPSAHGKGYATEAMTAVLAWSDAAHPRTVCIISPGNAGSLRVAAKLGFRELARTDYKTSEVIVFERLASPVDATAPRL